MKEKDFFEKETTLNEVIDLLKDIMPDKDPWVEKKDDKLIIAGVMAFVRNIQKAEHGIFREIEQNNLFRNVRWSTDDQLAVFADLVNPVDGVNKIEFRIDKDM